MTLDKSFSVIRTQENSLNVGRWYEIVDAVELALRLNVPTSWVYEQVRSRATDPMPHLRLGKYVRFQPDSPEFQEWLERHRWARKGAR